MGKSYWTLSCKVYSICHHHLLDIFSASAFVFREKPIVDRSPSKKKKQHKAYAWPITAFFLTFGLALVFSTLSETTLLGVSMPVAVTVLFGIILIGIVADVIGVSVTVQDVTAYTAMASRKIRGAKQAIRLVQNAERVSNVCNDVVGDICGIVSGAMGAAIIGRLVIGASHTQTLFYNVFLSALIAAVTVGGKAVGKQIAMKHSRQIVFTAAKIFAVFQKH